ncbi:MAG: dihydroorotase family protein [Pseudomonadota bacterium]
MSDLAITGGTLVLPDGLRPGTLLLQGGAIAGILGADETFDAAGILDATGLHVLPGAVDIHCHIRSPAYPHRGTVASETAAAAAGGVTSVFEMPITDPCCNSPEEVRRRRDHFALTAHTDFALYAAPLDLTEAGFEALAAEGVVALKMFTTPAPPGRAREFAGLSHPDTAEQLRVLQLAAKVGLPVVVHAEHPDILDAGHRAAATMDPSVAAIHNIARPVMAEALAVAQLLTLNIKAQARLHIAHVTAAPVLDILRRFAGSSDFSAETCPHYLMHDTDDVAAAGVWGKINPPVRTAADRDALWQALADGTLRHVTTDHAAFAPEEKAAADGDFLSAPPGHPGLEVLVPTVLDGAAHGKVSLAEAARLVAANGADRFGLPGKGRLAKGADADVILADLAGETVVTPESLLTNARTNARLSHGQRYRGRVVRTLLRGRTVWDGTQLTGTPGEGRFVCPHRP